MGFASSSAADQLAGAATAIARHVAKSSPKTAETEVDPQVSEVLWLESRPLIGELMQSDKAECSRGGCRLAIFAYD